jgi:hypothetical protein
MMMSCPKCGFTQPKDQYCAKCGVDMLAYKPAEPPLSRKLLSNWLVQIAILTVVLSSAYAFFSNRYQQAGRLAEVEDGSHGRVIDEMAAPVRDRRSAQAGDSGETAADSAATTSSSAAGDANTANTNADASRTSANADGSPAKQGTIDERNPASENSAASSGTSEFFKAAESSAGDSSSSGRTDTVATVQKVRITFAEVPRPLVAEILGNTRNVASYGTSSLNVGVVPDLSNRLKSAFDNTTYLLETASEYPVRINQPIVVFKGTRDVVTEQNIGLTTQITPIASDETGVQVQVEVMRVLREPAGASPDPGQSYQETFTITKEGGAFIAGMLPRRQLDEEESRFYAGAGVLRVLISPTFQTNNSEFIIFIEGR